MRIDDVRVHVNTRFHIEGSALEGTIRSWPLEFECRVAIQSPEPTDKVARLINIADRSCYVLQSFLNPVTVNRSVTLNGQALEA